MTRTDIEKAMIKLGMPEKEYEKLPDKVKMLACTFFIMSLCNTVYKQLASLRQKTDKRDDQ